jgi:hypothetical protein
MISAGLTKNNSDLNKLLMTMALGKFGKDMKLYCSDISFGIPLPKREMSESDLDALVKSPTNDGGIPLHDVLVQGLVELCKTKPVGNDAIQWLGEWLLANNPNQPQVSNPDC